MAVEITRWLFISCYFSSNVANSHIADKLEVIGGIIAALNKMPIVARDFNAKSPVRRSKSTNDRGTLVLEWYEQVGLVPINTEGRWTLERLFGTSKIDILLYHLSTAIEIECSRVLSLVTRSDHKYVWHEIGCTPVKERRRKSFP